MHNQSDEKSGLALLYFATKKILYFCCGLALASVLGLDTASAQINRTWIGTISQDWYNPTNWSPNGVPAANDIVNVTNGTANLSAPVVISNQFNWTGGILMGNALTIATNAVFNINASSTVYLENVLTNAGTVNETNTGSLIVQNGGGSSGLVVNLSGALWNIENDQTMVNNNIGNAYFQNSGTLQKLAGTGTTIIYISILNSGSVTTAQGTLNFFGGGTLAGSFTAANGSAINFANGGFTNSGPASINGPGPVQLTGGSLTLLANTISNLSLAGGTVNLGPAFQQGGVITNLTINGATLAGTNVVTGVFNWNNGTVAGGPLTIASSGVLNINGTTTLYLQSALTNAGTVNWTNTGNLVVQNGGGPSGLVVNLPGALWNIENDQIMVNNSSGNAYFQNAGTLQKSAGTGTTYIYIPIVNSGSVTAMQGTLDFFGGGTLAGTFAAGTSATLDFGNGGFTNSGPVSINGPGPVQLTGGTLELLTDAIPNLGLTAGTVNLGPAFQGGTITNLTITGATLAGTNTVTGVFNWNNGVITGGPLMIATNGLLNINGTTTLGLQSALTNAGTVIWTNTGPLIVENNGVNYSGLIVNLPGALWKIENDQTLENNFTGPAYFQNAGALQKAAGTGTTFIYIPLLNTGSVTALEGTMNFYGGGTLAGSFTANSGAAINFVLGSFTNSGPVSINGPGAVQLTGGTLTLLTDAIANLGLTGGTVDLGPAFQGGTITNLTINGATLGGTNTVTGVFNWNNGTIAGGPITIASNAVLNINGTTTLDLQSALTNAGTVNWTNTGYLNVQNGGGGSGLIVNQPGALWNIENNASMFNNFSGNAYFQNAGTLQKSAGTGMTFIYIPTTNSGVIAALKGNINFVNSSFVPNGGALLFGLSNSNSYGTVSIGGNATLGGTVGVLYENGFVPTSGNSFTVLSYGSYTGIFTNTSFPAGPIWITNYGPTSFTILASSINKLGFTTQPVGGVLANVTLAPVVVQVEDPGNNPVPISGLPITLALNSGSGTLSGTLTQNTDATGKATYSDLSINSIGTKTLRATYAELTTAVSVPFQIIPLVGLQLSHSGFLIQLNGNNNLNPLSIYASTNLYTWTLIYTNGPTNGQIQYLDTAATNYPHRFYHFVVP